MITIDIRGYYGLPVTTKRSDFIWRQTKKIPVKGGFTRSVYPYIIKSIAITDGFNQQINPKILQRQAKHRNIETTLRYDHSTDEMVKDCFQQKNWKKLITNFNIGVIKLNTP